MFERIKAARKKSQGSTELKRLLIACDRLLGESGESVSIAMAQDAIERFHQLDGEHRRRFYKQLANRYNPDPQTILESAQAFAQSNSAQDLIHLVQVTEPPRQELFRRLNRARNGTQTIVQMRREIIAELKSDPDLAAVDADLGHLLSSWFNPGFLQLDTIDWSSPALLLEQVIAHEAVHAIDGWNDLRRRLQPDRRLFAYFHPTLAGEPLIFVEVALLPEMPDAIAPLLDRGAEPDLDARHYKVAAFYSISNCQPGLKGIHLGNFLIKRVAEKLQDEFPSIKTFCTLSPIPTFAKFLKNDPVWHPQRFTRSQIESLNTDHATVRGWITSKDFDARTMRDAQQELMGRLCAAYLWQTSPNEAIHSDPVARFHLNNGAQLDRINARADLSAKGLRESFGYMVNYKYELNKIESRHEDFVADTVAVSRGVKSQINL